MKSPEVRITIQGLFRLKAKINGLRSSCLIRMETNGCFHVTSSLTRNSWPQQKWQKADSEAGVVVVAVASIGDVIGLSSWEPV